MELAVGEIRLLGAEARGQGAKMPNRVLDKLTEEIGRHLPVLGVSREPRARVIVEAPTMVCEKILNFATRGGAESGALVVEGGAGALFGVAEDRLILLGAREDAWCDRLEKELVGLFKFIAEFEATRHAAKRADTRPAGDRGDWKVLCDEGLRPIAVLGRGGHADCILCEDPQDGHVVAKRFRSAKLFQQERWVYSLLGETRFSPSMLKTIPELSTIVMTHIQAEPIQEMPRTLLTSWLPSVLASFDTALEHFRRHSPALVHRDIKPRNVLFGTDRAYLIDYSSAETAERRRGPTGDKLGKDNKLGNGGYSFKAFEQMIRARKQSCKVDVFGCAATIFWCLYGIPPYRNLASEPAVARRFYERRHDLITGCLRRDFGAFGVGLAECLSVRPSQRRDTLRGLSDLLEGAGSATMVREACDLV